MERYIGTKLINAKPMTRLEYNRFRGWELPTDENGEDAGYLVEYVDGGKANHPDFEGYISWSPKDVFERAYSKVNSMTFGVAIEILKRGKKVARHGWNGKGMSLSLVRAALVNGTVHAPYIQMRTVDGALVPWLASQTDMLAEDWHVVE